MIVSDTRKNPTTISQANLAYAGETSSNVQYLMVKNEKLEKNLQATRKEVKKIWESVQNAVYALGKMRTMILVEILALGDTIWNLYDGFVTTHKEFVCLHGLQQQSKEFSQNLKKIHASITHVQELTMRYKGAPLDLENKMKP